MCTHRGSVGGTVTVLSRVSSSGFTRHARARFIGTRLCCVANGCRLTVGRLGGVSLVSRCGCHHHIPTLGRGYRITLGLRRSPISFRPIGVGGIGAVCSSCFPDVATSNGVVSAAILLPILGCGGGIVHRRRSLRMDFLLRSNS